MDFGVACGRTGKHILDVLRTVCGEACAMDFGVACGRTRNTLSMNLEQFAARHVQWTLEWPAEG